MEKVPFTYKAYAKRPLWGTAQRKDLTESNRCHSVKSPLSYRQGISTGIWWLLYIENKQQEQTEYFLSSSVCLPAPFCCYFVTCIFLGWWWSVLSLLWFKISLRQGILSECQEMQTFWFRPASSVVLDSALTPVPVLPSLFSSLSFS